MQIYKDEFFQTFRLHPFGGSASNFFELFMVNNSTSLIVSALSSDHSTDMLLLLRPLDS